MSKHTEGPWEHGSNFAGGTDILSGRLGERIVVGRAIDNSLVDFSEYVANARLIAAAPELLEALEALSALNDNHGPFGGEIYQDRIDRAWDAARAAIAKAKGVKPSPWMEPEETIRDLSSLKSASEE